MKFSSLFGTLALATTALAGICDRGPIKLATAIGGPEGVSRCETRWDEGLIVKAVEVWFEGGKKTWIRGFQLQYSNGEFGPILGNSNGNNHRFEWDPSLETIEKVTLWGDGVGKSLGRIYMRTSKGREFEVGRSVDDQKAYDQELGSGYLLGVYGRSSWKIDSLGWVSLNGKPSSIEVTDVEFDTSIATLNAKKEGLEEKVLDTDYYENKRSVKDSHVFKSEEKRSFSTKITNTLANTFGASLKVTWKAGLPLLAGELEAGIHWEITKTKSTETTTTFERALSWWTEMKVAPGAGIYCEAYSTQGTFSSGYNSMVTVYLEDKTKYSFKQRGTVDKIAWSTARTRCWDCEDGDCKTKVERRNFNTLSMGPSSVRSHARDLQVR